MRGCRHIFKYLNSCVNNALHCIPLPLNILNILQTSPQAKSHHMNPKSNLVLLPFPRSQAKLPPPSRRPCQRVPFLGSPLRTDSQRTQIPGVHNTATGNGRARGGAIIVKQRWVNSSSSSLYASRESAGLNGIASACFRGNVRGSGSRHTRYVIGGISSSGGGVGGSDLDKIFSLRIM